MEYLWLSVLGASLGWLVGLSASPVVNTVVGGLLAATAGVLVAYRGGVARDGERPAPSAAPLAVLVFALACSATVAAKVRDSRKDSGDEGPGGLFLHTNDSPFCTALLPFTFDNDEKFLAEVTAHTRDVKEMVHTACTPP